jgi:adenylate cyclase
MRDLARRLLPHAVEIAFSLLILLWIAVGLFFHSGVDPLRLATALYGSGRPVAWVLVAACSWALAVVCLFKIIAALFAERFAFLAAPDQAGSIVLAVAASAAAIGLIVLDLSARAASSAYFGGLPPLDYAAAAGSMGFNAWSVARLVGLASLRDASYREYLEFRKETHGTDGHPARLLLRASIRKKLTLSFMGLILAVIVVLATVLMSGFSRTILGAVIDNGSSLTDRAASVIKANLGDEISISDYFGIERKKNSSARFPFTSLSFYTRTSSGDTYAVTHSTNRQLLNRELPEGYREAKEAGNRYNASRKTFEFLSPVVLSNILVGYLLADYDRDLIYEPYFRTQVRVILVAALFVYASIFVIHIFGNHIVFPILFLGMSVNRISATLGSMIHGSVRVSADLLHFEDRILTRDEIKMLSGEIGNMITVIKGIIPYISASTLKQSERGELTSRNRDLTFLFTDIRGFTNLCEGMSPPEVVKILNHYLDLQAGIIIQHHGDIDKFVGDEVMGEFEGPGRDINACRAAMAIRTEIGRARDLAEAGKQDLITIGIGINSGPVVWGSVGSKDRMDFTSIGDTVNLAARLEGANKTYGTKSLITEAVYEKVKEAYLCREIDLMTVKGKTQPVRIYEILQERSKAAVKLTTLARSFEKGLASYRAKKWDAAIAHFEPLASTLNDKPSRVFMDRIEMFRASPPPRSWDGVFALNVK